ncbi:putative glycoside hydrolase [Roseateles saccharophilus]|uniref:DUF4015 domain-containing protein n=1 Tax=Roseateles saccharophilus TaxID=304 RepID=A0A4R3UG89_ROSSA|nr:putative glycoside hydrolase [Roseateles saccharophilus]MDG0834463.1 GTP-binding protein [Roseateles saccharophilus]TCU89825.1 hypothetical protein EV671_10324 [Roseateles saccharophilus]
MRAAASIWLALVLGIAALPARALDGMVKDAETGRPIPFASVVVGAEVRRCDAQGRFEVGEPVAGGPITARAPGYARYRGTVAPSAPLALALKPLRPKALYLSVYGIGSAKLRGDALKLIDDTELNALVIDVKGDRGLVPYPSAALTAAGLAQTLVTVRDMAALVRSLHERGLYLIARIVTFKDEPYATAHPEWAVHDAQGAVWKDREGLAWIDPFRRMAWERNLALAEEAAVLGFDEIQFDYLRFPDASGLAFSEPDTEDRRIAAIGGFLDAAQQRLGRYNVFVAADIFGYVTWNSNDTHIGQQLEAIAGHVDYLSPMLYPSGFSFGIPGYRDPVAAPYEIVQRSLQRALARTGLPGTRFRPWLQAFRDYAFDRRVFGEHEIRAQIEAADAVGTNGWMLWNPGNRYAEAGLEPETSPLP